MILQFQIKVLLEAQRKMDFFMGHRQAAIQMYAKLLGNINKYFQNDDHCQPVLKDFVGEKCFCQ